MSVTANGLQIVFLRNFALRTTSATQGYLVEDLFLEIEFYTSGGTSFILLTWRATFHCASAPPVHIRAAHFERIVVSNLIIIRR